MLSPGQRQSVFASLRNAFLSGLLMLAPLAVTWIVFAALFEKVGGNLRPLFFPYIPEKLQHYDIVWNIVATFIAILLVTLLGYVSRYVLGKYFGGLAERFILTIPGVSNVYNTVKQIVATFSAQQRQLFSKVVMVQFPRDGVYSLGFLTNKAQGEPQEKTGLELWTVFIPTTPNPTSGFLILLPKEKIIELDMSVGDGMKMIISGGAVSPAWMPTSSRSPVDTGGPSPLV
jgi:uncharacterized membrane protein